MKTFFTLKTVLRSVLNGQVELWQHERLTAAERGVLVRWAEDGTEGAEFTSLWQQMEKDARTVACIYPLNAATIFKELVRGVLRARRIATNAQSGDDPYLREKQEHREELLKLAGIAQDLSDYFSEVSQHSGLWNKFREALLMPLLDDI